MGGKVILSKLLHGERVRLNGLTADDLPIIARWFEDAEFMRLFDARPARTRSETELARWLDELHKNKDSVAFAGRGFC